MYPYYPGYNYYIIPLLLLIVSNQMFALCVFAYKENIVDTQLINERISCMNCNKWMHLNSVPKEEKSCACLL